MKYLISPAMGNTVLAQMNFWFDLVQLFWHFSLLYFFFPCYKNHDAASSVNMYLSLANSLNTGGNKRREGHENRLCSSFQICGVVPQNCKTSWFYLPGICWERGEYWKSNSATSQNAFRRWCGQSSPQPCARGWHHPWDRDLLHDNKFPSGNPWQWGCCKSAGKDLEK